ncbi:MAG: hypothetical protein QXI33_00965 [Candidatus Pacearchaeota archaeon]
MNAQTERGLPEYIKHELEEYKKLLRGRKIVGFVECLYSLEQGMASLSEEKRGVITELIVGNGISLLESINRDSEDYHFFAGNIAAYLQNIRHNFLTHQSFNRNICLNLAYLFVRTRNPLAFEILEDCLDIKRNWWKDYRELYG